MSNILSYKDTWYLRKFLYEHLSSLGIAKLENPELTNKTTRFNEIQGFINTHLTLTVNLIASIVTIFSGAIIIVKFVPILAPVLFILFVMKFFVNQKYIGLTWKLNREATEERRRASNIGGTLSDPVSLKEIIITNSANFLSKKYMNYVYWAVGQFNKIQFTWFKFELGQSFIDAIVYGFGLYLVIVRGISESISIGLISFYLRTLASLYDQLDHLSYRLGRLRDSAIRIKDVKDLFELYQPDKDGDVILEDDSLPRNIEFNNVSFTYPNSQRSIFNNLNLTIQAGEKIAIVGENGAGKTTLVKLLSRLYSVNEGKILIDDHDINNLNISSWYNKLGVLFQDYNAYPHLTVADNVGIGKIVNGKINRKKVKQALKEADALEFVEAYPDKLDQVLSERYKGGIRPSTGQWQKLGIARFFYRNAPVLILDEPTASIDAVAEAEIFNNIYKFVKNKTVIIISHRFSTVRNADRIIVLDKGRIIEEGSHEELLKKDGKYAKAFKLQAKGYE